MGRWSILRVLLITLSLSTSALGRSDSAPMRCRAAASVPSTPLGLPAREHFYSLESTDGLSHTVAVEVPAPYRVEGVRSFRAWWELERPHAEALQATIAGEDRLEATLDRQRWMAILAFAPGLWPFAGGSASLLATQESIDEANPLPFPQWDLEYVPLDDLAYPLLRETERGPQGELRELFLVPNSTSADPRLPPVGLVLLGNAADESPPALRIQEIAHGRPIGEPFQLIPTLTRTYGAASERAERTWRPPSRQALTEVFSLFEVDAPGVLEVVVPQALVRVRYERAIDAATPAPVIALPARAALAPGWFALLSLLAYFTVGWILAPPRDPLPASRRLIGLALGWLAGWAVALLGLPLLGLGFLPGAAVTLATWEHRGLGALTARRYAWLVAFLLLWSALAWSQLASEGLLPPGRP